MRAIYMYYARFSTYMYIIHHFFTYVYSCHIMPSYFYACFYLYIFTCLFTKRFHISSILNKIYNSLKQICFSISSTLNLYPV